VIATIVEAIIGRTRIAVAQVAVARTEAKEVAEGAAPEEVAVAVERLSMGHAPIGASSRVRAAVVTVALAVAVYHQRQRAPHLLLALAALGDTERALCT